MKVKITLLTLMFCYCLYNQNIASAASYTSTVYVPRKGLYVLHSERNKTSTSKYLYASNASGTGEYAYCYGSVSAKISTSYISMSDLKKLDKDNSQKTFTLYNTVDQGKSVRLHLTGADSQSGNDNNRVTFYY